ILKYPDDEIGRKLRTRRNTRSEHRVIDLEAFTQALGQGDVEPSSLHQRAVSTNGFRLHDREDVRIKRLDRGDAVGAAELDVAAGDGLEGIAAGACNRRLGEIEDVLDHTDLADRIGLACSG